MFIVLIRTVLLYALLIFIMRLMGKRQLGELQPYEFAITILISDLVAMPMQDTRLPLILGVIPIVTLLFIKIILSKLQLKSQLARKILEGEPCVLICRGKVNYQALKSQQINLDELMEEIRLAGYFDLQEIQYGILENNGQLSFLTSNSNGNNKNETYENYISNGSSSHKQLPVIYVLDGKVNRNSLTTCGKNKEWIENKLKSYNINSIDNVLLAMTDTNGNFLFQLHDEFEKRCSK